MMDEKKPTYLEVSNHFYTDAVDLLKRFRHCYYSDAVDFSVSKSIRMKCFIDLRMAHESVLKSIEAYFNLFDRSGSRLVNKVEKYGHKIGKLTSRIEPHVPDEFGAELKRFGDDLRHLPIHLRYKLDVLDYFSEKADFYYKTAGSDIWINSLFNLTDGLTKFIGKKLSSHSRIVNGADLWEEYVASRYVKSHNSEDPL